VNGVSSTHDLIVLLDHYGHTLFYGLTFCWTALEGETFVILAGYLAHKGLISFPLLLAFAWCGSFAGDQVYFYLGRRYGTRLITRFPRWRPGTDKALCLIERNSTWFILTFRFIYGIRNVSSFAVGMSHVSWRRFGILNFSAAGLWAMCFAGFGYFAASAARRMFGTAPENVVTYVGLGALVLFCIVAWFMLHRPAKQRAKRAARAAAETAQAVTTVTVDAPAAKAQVSAAPVSPV
jgi:membrane protein DedA with SNARE-associated domain